MYVFICLHSLLPEAATGVEVFVRKGVLKNSVNLTKNLLPWSIFLINLQAWHLFSRTSINDCFCTALARLAVTYRFYFILSSYKSSHRRCSLKKGVLINFAKDLHFRTCFLQNQLQNTSRQLLLHLLPHYHCYYYQYLRCFSSFKLKRLQRIWIWYLIFTKSLPLVLSSFSMFFLSFSVLFPFLLPLLIKRILLSWELIKMFLPLTSLKYVHVSK